VSETAPPLAEGLAALEREGLLRRRRVLDSPQGARVRVDGRDAINFSSNDYLGLANHPRLRAAAHAAIDAWGVGSGASPLVTGQARVHEAAEARFAAFSRLPRALLFPSGYAANLGVLSALCGRHAEIFADRLNHACLNDGALLSRATFTRYAHGDLGALADRLAASPAPVRVVATDAVFSMDGDVAALPEMLALCERHDAWLLVDDAHGIGVLGADGTTVFTTNNADAGTACPSGPGEFDACVTIPPNTLLAGDFHLALCLWNAGAILDLQEPALSFSVEAGRSPLYAERATRKGYVHVDCAWSVAPRVDTSAAQQVRLQPDATLATIHS